MVNLLSADQAFRCDEEIYLLEIDYFDSTQQINTFSLRTNEFNYAERFIFFDRQHRSSMLCIGHTEKLVTVAIFCYAKYAIAATVSLRQTSDYFFP